jgi:hypothetical protein
MEGDHEALLSALAMIDQRQTLEGHSLGIEGQRRRVRKPFSPETTVSCKSMRTRHVESALIILSTLLVVVTVWHRVPSHRVSVLAPVRKMSPEERVVAALKDTHLFWGAAAQLEDEDVKKAPQPWRDSDFNLQAIAKDAIVLCEQIKEEESRGEEAVQDQGKGRRRRCVHHVVRPQDTRFTHTPAGLNDWTQPSREYPPDGEALGPEHNTATALQKVIDQFKPHTEWHGKKIYSHGVMLRVPTYDRSKFLGFGGAGKEANIFFDPSSGDRKSNGFTTDSDKSDESYDRLMLDAEQMVWGARRKERRLDQTPKNHKKHRRAKGERRDTGARMLERSHKTAPDSSLLLDPIMQQVSPSLPPSFPPYLSLCDTASFLSLLTASFAS